MRWLLLVLFCFCVGANAWEVNDISILLPLPERGEELEMLGPQAGRTLLPREVYDLLPNVVLDIEPTRLYAQALKVVAIRIDPCFKEHSPCQKQIRLVWQPLIFETGRWITLDGAIHSFYSIDDVAWEQMLRDLKEFKSNSGPNLMVHPKIKRQGYHGFYWTKLEAILLKYCGKENIVRATAMTVNPIGTVWTFSGVNIVSSNFEAIEMVGSRDSLQGIFVNPELFSTKEFIVNMNPFPLDKRPMVRLLNDSQRAQVTMTEDELAEATRHALRLENPKIANTTNSDCASCHISHVVTSWSLRNFSAWDWEKKFSGDIYRSENKLERPQERDFGANVLRAFGYFVDRPVISRRVENETKEALKKME